MSAPTRESSPTALQRAPRTDGHLDAADYELWDGPASEAVAVFEFAKARLTGQKPNLGENRKVTVPM